MIILVGAPGAGKSYFSTALETARPSEYVRINQDELKTRKKCEKICRETIQSGKIPIIDRCNFNAEQRSHFLKIAKESSVDVDCVIFEYPRDVLIERCQNRVNHDTVTSTKAKRVVNLILGRICHPDTSGGSKGENFRERTIVRSTKESDEVVDNILNKKSINVRAKRVAEETADSSQPTKKQKTSSDVDVSVAPVKKATPGPDGFYKIYCDLDGVLADFDAGVKRIFNGRHPDNIGSIQLWSGINKADRFYENLPMTPDGQELWDTLVAAFASESTTKQPLPDILTGVPRTKRFRQEKFDWCVEKLGPGLGDGIHCNHVDMAGPKKSHTIVKGTKKESCVNIITCWSDNKHIESCPGAVLIDDREKFAKDWEKKGGTFIHHINTATTIKKMKACGILP